MASAKIPEHDYSVSELEEKKLYAVTFQYQLKTGEWFTDTLHKEAVYIFEAPDDVDSFCNSVLDFGNWDAYEITNINVIKR